MWNTPFSKTALSKTALSKTALSKTALLLGAATLFGGCSMTDSSQTSSPAAGISLELARSRAARIAAPVSYDLSFRLTKGVPKTDGTVTVAFELSDATADLPIDFGGTLSGDCTLNGVRLDLHRVENHLILPASALRAGANVLTCGFSSKIAPTGTPLTVYRDASDGAEYYYTLVVPADAHRLFPCFDQPDIKGTFKLELNTPLDWVAVANGSETRTDGPDQSANWTFTRSKPLPTYLFAFAAGPFKVVKQAGIAGSRRGLTEPMRIFYRTSKEEDLDPQTLFSMHARSVAWQEDYFGYDYPFGKLDIVLCPGFPYGGMEHAGAIFYRETALVYDHEPTELERLRRSTLIYHEVSHQWFGNLVTMEWFDDLWLKEGFATFVGYRTLDALEPSMNAWMRFHQRVKPAALRIDVTEGTTPIWQRLDNLADAKSAYGPIVYNKAPSVLRQLEQDLGQDVFRDGVRLFLKRHAFGNATWRDLLDAIGATAEKDLEPWSRMWILDRGLPLISAIADEDNSVTAGQTDILGAPKEWRKWPFSARVLMGFADGSRRTVTATFGPEDTVKALDTGGASPTWLLANSDAVAFALVTLDAKSAAYWFDHLAGEEDPLVKAVAFSALWDTVRTGDADPARFAETALGLIERERDPQTWASAMGALRTTLVRYLDPERAAAPARRAAKILGALLHDKTAAPIRLQVLRALVSVARDEAGLARIERILDGTETVPGLKLGIRDRFRLVTALLAAKRPGAEQRLARLEAAGSDVARWAYQAKAAIPTKASKAAYFTTFMQPSEPPEQWITGALGAFHWPGQEALVLPYLERALDAAVWVKENRRIFFMPAWLESFLGGHASAEALRIVEAWLDRNADLPVDIRRKLLVPLHELRRAVKLRSRAAPPGS